MQEDLFVTTLSFTMFAIFRQTGALEAVGVRTPALSGLLVSYIRRTPTIF